ncbi:MAG: T9SS type A sorting domain-containing protein, partial [Bacteroidetes bacterium]|nr:T9SS type A sorting domain-containing protein [Bacteroidota bacterium]
SESRLAFLNLAQRITFGKASFPWFHYELGSNLKSLFQIWKGPRNGSQAIIFEVPENASQLIVVAMDSINPQLFDFSLISPTGKIYNSGNTSYQQFPDSKQTLMMVDMPIDGDWQFITAYTGNVALNFSAPNQKPTGMVNQPGTKQTLSNQVSLSFNDYADTIHVEVYYDTDRKNFDGSFIDDFSIVNNANLTFEWQNETLPNGEYFIYTRVDDGKNTPVLLYAPGSILVQNDANVETPQNMNAIQQGDSVIVSWNAPVQTNTYSTTVYYKDKSTQRTETESATDSTHLILKGLAPGRGYEIWCKFLNDAGFYGLNSNVQTLVFAGSAGNNPPYFTMDRDSSFIFVTGQEAAYTLLASDADGNVLSFTLPGDTLGINIAGNQLNWNPAPDQKGSYKVMIVVSDGSSTDTTWQKLVVYTPEQMNVNISFSSVRLYEQDNMFITIRNFSCPDEEQSVTLANLRSGQQTTVTCSRVNEFEYIGQFELTFTKSIAIAVANGDSLKASYSWDGENYQTFAYYDSLPQPSDQIPPGIINNLSVERLPGNQLKLSWTATGNDGAIGKAFRYDIRYANQPIASETIYFTASLIASPPYPSVSGEPDSLIVNLTDLQPSATSDSVYFALKAGDEMQNWGALGNSPGVPRLVVPTNISAQVTGMVNISLDWDGPVPVQPPVNGFLYYKLFRGINNGSLLLYQTGVTQTNFTDSLRDYPDGPYQYAIQAVYAAGTSDSILAPVVNLHRFVNVNILAGLEWAGSNEGISMQLTGLDTVYSQTFNRISNITGLMLMGNVFKTMYAIQLTKTGYVTVFDTIEVTADPSEFEYVLARNIPAAINLQNINLQSGMDSCFEATQTITVAGSGTEFNVQSGASVNLVAGQKITILPVSKVFSGGSLHAFITPNNQYCSSFKILPFQNPEDDDKNTFFKVYPNPTEGRFVVEVNKELEGSKFQVVNGSRFKVQVYNLFGVEVLEEQILTTRITEFSIQNQPPGIYIIRVVNGNQSGTSKIIKL